ncbi:MAG: cupin domain-containing protein [Acidobacteria bacterium]|nr:cupin domain-containing protein [Acidobacteriota bacterium]
MPYLKLGLLLSAGALMAAERPVDPTWLRRHVPALKEKPAEVTTPACHYKPIFGAGDPDARLLRGITRFAEITVDAGGACAPTSFPAEEQVYVILEGSGALLYGEDNHPVRKSDFLYLPPGVRHAMQNPSGQPCRLIVMGFRIPSGDKPAPPPKLLIANIDDVPKQVVGGHPPSTLFQLLMGATTSQRDKIAAGHVLTSLFTMEFDPGGTNFPHHHDREEEIYLVLEGHGEMVAGGGMAGVEGKHPAKVGDAYFFRLNCTVGFYGGNKPGEPKSRILAVRSLYPFRR